MSEFDVAEMRNLPRYRKARMCICPPDNMGWGCCCAGVTTVKEDPDGPFVLLRADVLAYLLDRVPDGAGA